MYTGNACAVYTGSACVAYTDGAVGSVHVKKQITITSNKINNNKVIR